MSQLLLREYPNVRARLRLIKQAPLLPTRESYMDIWLNQTRFRIRDEAGRDVTTILTDVLASRGLGAPARTIEDMMDAFSETYDAPASRPTQIFGDLATMAGWVYGEGQPPWSIVAEQLAPAAEQILAGELETPMTFHQQTTRLNRLCAEYRGILVGVEEGIPYKSIVTRVVSQPYLLFSHVHDEELAEHSYTREVVALEEGEVTDLDLTPP
ncbi:hypothetical protein [Nostoc sp. FACHB-133]|uniref:hypothetical protein n=1 Tax=Nostoc sp. FACHB-133 TaxID=2692835 RepID=UPI001689DCAC|nr:hypothetical protein [Nostoc sp. FACHB-133]MBD2526251.1 hypothetical protein [Nostoc sp. FACHB-133]